MKTEKSLQKITTGNLEAAGIKSQINQNDIIDIIVEKKLQELDNTIDLYITEGKNLETKMQGLTEEAIISFVKELSTLGFETSEDDVKVNPIYAGDKGGYTSKIGDLYILRKDRDNYVSIGIKNFYEVKSVELSKSITEEVPVKKGLTSFVETTYVKTVKSNKAKNEAIKAEILEYNKKIKAFMDSIPGKDWREKKIDSAQFARSIKNAFNKNILNSQAKDVVLKIEELFNVKLD